MRTSSIRIRCLVVVGILAAGCGDDDGGNQNNENRNQSVPVCGDGVVDTGESCDDGPDNSDVTPDACRTTCRPAYCGDGVIDTGETCDDGPDNSDIVPGACRRTCVEATCGDGIIDPGEACDRGEANADAPGECRTTCELPACGDGIIDPGEVCYGYAGVAAPTGFLLPVDVESDGDVDLVGYAFSSITGETMPQGLYEVALAGDGGFATGQLYLTPPYASPVASVGRLAGPTERPVHVTGLYPVLLSGTDPDGRLSLPSVFRAMSATGTGGGPLPVPFVDAGGLRWVATVDLLGKQICLVPVTDADLLDVSGKTCFFVPLTGGDTDRAETLRAFHLQVDDPQVLAFLVGTKTGRYLRLVQVNGSTAAYSETQLDTGWALEMPSPGVTAPPRLLSFGAAGGLVLRERTWNPGLATFDATQEHPLPDVPIAPGCETAPYVFAAGRLGGTGAGLDHLLVHDPEGTPGSCPAIRIRDNGGDGRHLEVCIDASVPAFAAVVRGVAVADLTGGGVDDVAVLYGSALGGTSQVRIFGNVATGGCAASAMYDIPAPLVGLDALRLDGTSPQVLVLTAGFPSEGGIAPAESALVWRLFPDAGMEVLPLGAVTADLRRFPSGPSGAEGLLGVTGEGGSEVFLLRGEGGALATGRRVRDAAGEPFDRLGVHSLVGDVDADGQEDLVLIDSAGVLHVYLGPVEASTGRFADHASALLPGGYPGYAIVADVDGIPGVELLTLVGNPVEAPEIPDDTISVYRLRDLAGGVLLPTTVLHPGLDPRLVDVGHFNDDGLLDIVAVHGLSSTVTVTLNATGLPGEFPDPPVSETLVPGFPVTVSAIDMDNDGQVDAVVSMPDAGLGPLLLRGTGDGGFLPAENLALSGATFGVWPYPANPDGSRDLVLVRLTQSLEFNTIVLGANP